MTATLDAVASRRAKPEPSARERAAEEPVRREQGLSLTGPDGLLKQLTKLVLGNRTGSGDDRAPGPGEERLGRERDRERPQRQQGQDGADRGAGEVGTEVPRDREGTFEPQIARKRSSG